MKNQPPVRRSLVKRGVVYVLMTGAVLLFSTLLLFLLLGYRFNKTDGTFQQGGLVQFISRPTGAKVTIGTAELGNRTNTKITVNPGNYTVKMEKDGYTTWQKRVAVEAGKVLWLNSVQFVPSSPVTESVANLPSTLGSTASREDSDYYAYVANPTLAELSLVRVNDNNPTTRALTIKPSVYSSAKAHNFKIVSVFEDDKHFLIRHGYDKKSEWIVVNSDDQTKDRVLGSSAATLVEQVYENPRDRNTVFLKFRDGTVKSQNLDNGQLSGTLLSGVDTMSVSEQGTILFSKRTSKSTVEAGYLSYGVGEPRYLARYTTTTPVYLASGVYYGDFYITTTHAKTLTITKYDDFPRSDDQASIKATLIKTIDSEDQFSGVEMRNDGRFAVARQVDSLVVYDLQIAQQSVTPLYKVTKSSQQVSWLGDYHYFTDVAGRLRQYEFDGSNQTDIASVAPGNAAVYSSNLKYLYSVSKAGDGYQLQRTSMIVE